MDPFIFGETLFKTLQQGPTTDNIANYREAETQYKQLLQNPQQLITLSLTVLSKSTNESCRLFTATMLNQDVMDKSKKVYSTLPSSFRSNFDTAILNNMNSESNSKILKVYASIVKRMFEQLYDAEIDCLFVLNAVFAWIQSGDKFHRESAFDILTDGIIYDQSMAEFNKFLPQYMSIMQFGLGKRDASWLKDVFKLYSISIISTTHDNDERNYKQMIGVFPVFIQQIKEFIESSNESDIVFDLITTFDEMMMEIEDFENEHISAITEMMIPICLNGQKFNDDVKTQALELLVTLTENYSDFMKKNTVCSHSILNVIVYWISTVQVTQEWLNNEDDDDQLVFYSQATEALFRLVDSLGTSFVWRYITIHQAELLNGQWQQRHVYLQFIMKLLCGSSKKMKKQTENILQTITKFCMDESPRNRLIALIICNKISTLDRTLCQQSMPVIMNFVNKLMGDQVPRIVARTCDFVSSILDNFKIETIQGYIENILLQLLTLMQTNQKSVVSEAVCAISFIAIKLKKNFIPYYPKTMEILKKVLDSLGIDPNLFEVKGRIIECLSVIGMYLEEKHCIECAQIIFNEVDKVLKIPNLKIENSLFGFVETSFTRIAEILKDKFVQYLPTVLQIVLQRCQMNVVVSDEEMKQRGLSEDDVESMTIDKKQFAVHTALTEEKRNAVNAISDFANDLEPYFYPFAEKCLETILPLVKDPYDEELRAVASKATYRLLKAYYLGSCKECNSEQIAKQKVATIFFTCIKQICEQLENEKYVDTITKILGYLNSIISILGENSIAPEVVGFIVNTLKVLFFDAVKRVVEDEKEFLDYERRKNRRGGNDEDDDEDEDMLESIKANRKTELLLRIEFRRIVSNLSKNNPVQMTQAFTSILMPIINEAMGMNNPPEIQKHVTIFSESLLTTFASDSNNPGLIQQLTQMFIAKLNQNNVTESVLINLSILIQYPSVKEKVPEVAQICQRYFPLKETQKSLYRSSLMLYGKCLIYEDRLCNETVVTNYVNILPIQDFYDESVSTLFTLITKRMIPINMHTLKKIIDILVRVVDESGLDDITNSTKEMLRFYFNEWSQKNANEFNTIFNQYDDEEKQAIYELCGINN